MLHSHDPFLSGSSFYAKSRTRPLSNGQDSCGRVGPALSRKMWWSNNHLTSSRPSCDWHIPSVIYSYRSRRITCSHWSVPILVGFSPPTSTPCRCPARRKPRLRLLSNVNIQRRLSFQQYGGCRILVKRHLYNDLGSRSSAGEEAFSVCMQFDETLLNRRCVIRYNDFFTASSSI